jgi:hypothetical protein
MNNLAVADRPFRQVTCQGAAKWPIREFGRKRCNGIALRGILQWGFENHTNGIAFVSYA